MLFKTNYHFTNCKTTFLFLSSIGVNASFFFCQTQTLLLLDYLLKNGSDRIVNEVRSRIHELKDLTRFHHIDSEDVDRGISIRERAKLIIELISDTDRLKLERKKAKQVYFLIFYF